MAMKTFFLLSSAVVLLSLSSVDAQGLKVGFYEKTCPKAEDIVRKEMARVISVAPSLSGPLLRMHFHDCFIRGCDGSVLLNTTKKMVAEKDAPPNLSLRGFGVIDGIKAKLEKACPGIVSCADILALVARDAVLLTKGPFWEVHTGRRDGKISNASDTITELARPNDNISQLKALFARKGLSAKDLAVLSGGHTLGTSHCPSFTPRIYNFTGKGDADPSIDKNYVAKLKAKCSATDTTTLVEMDPGSVRTFDASYFKLVTKRRVLFVSDEALLHDSVTKAYVQKAAAAAATPSQFFEDFGASMVNMGNIGVLTGTQGEIRKQCAFVN